MLKPLTYSVISMAMLLAACTSMPTGPSVAALPGTGKGFDQFRQDNNYCKQYSLEEVGGTSASRAANDSLAESAVVGTAIGAALGAAAGGHSGAAVGAGTGLLVGTLAGTGAAEESSYNVQQRYDHAYIQCMYAKGHRVPVSGRFMDEYGPSPYRSPSRRSLPPEDEIPSDYLPPPPPPR